MAAVAYYVTPYEAATKLWIIPTAVVSVLFPAFSSCLTNDRRRTAFLFEKGLHYIFLALFPVVVCAVAFGRSALTLWLGKEMANHCAPIFRLLVIGVLANSLAQVPFWHIQAANRPDLTAKVHLLELPCYLFILRILLGRYGVYGAGIAWALRATADALVMFWVSSRLLTESIPYLIRLLKTCLVASLALSAVFFVEDVRMACILIAAEFAVLAPLAWFYFLSPEDHSFVKNPGRFVSLLRRRRVELTERA